jgi:hypothetical protein
MYNVVQLDEATCELVATLAEISGARTQAARSLGITVLGA